MNAFDVQTVILLFLILQIKVDQKSIFPRVEAFFVSQSVLL